MTQRYDVLGFGLLALAVALFALMGTTDNFFNEQSWLVRWQSLLGSLLGAAGTILAGWFALHGVNRQIAHTQQQLLRSQEAAKIAATIALTQPVHSAGFTLCLVRVAHARSYQGDLVDRIEADRLVEQSVEQLKAALEHFSLREVASDMDSLSRAHFLAVIGRLSTFVTIATSPVTNLSREGLLRQHILLLEGTYPYIAVFSADLGRKFAEDGEMAIASPEASAETGEVNPPG
jgi:hypothetical protein